MSDIHDAIRAAADMLWPRPLFQDEHPERAEGIKTITRHLQPFIERLESPQWPDRAIETLVNGLRQQLEKERGVRLECIERIVFWHDDSHEDIAGLPAPCPGPEKCTDAYVLKAAEALDKEKG